MTDDFKAIKDLIDITEEITRRTGKGVKKVGDAMDLEQCPFCHGHNCFRIRPKDRSWSCHQCDGKNGGTIIDFVMKERGCDLHTALVELAQAHNYPLTEQGQGKAGAAGSGLTDHASFPIFQAASEHYSMTLFNTRKALDYQRNIRGHSEKVLKDFHVGFSGPAELMPALLKQGFSLDDLLTSGLVVPDKKGGHRDFIIPELYVYPHRDIQGRVCHFSLKDPRKKFNYQLSNAYRIPGAPFMNMTAFKGYEIVLVEGENDLLSVCDKGGYPGAVAIIGQISEEQIKYLVDWCNGPSKRFYLCFDNDRAGDEYRGRIIKALERFCYPDKLIEINEEIRKRIERKNLEGESREPVEDIPKLKPAMVKTILFDRDVNDIDDYLKAKAEPAQEFTALLTQARRHLKPLDDVFPTLRAWHKAHGGKPLVNQAGEIVFDYFNTTGGFFVNGEDCRLFYANRIYEIGNNLRFKSMIYQSAGLNYADNGTKSILEVLKAEAFAKGKHTHSIGWIHTDKVKQAIYYDLRNEQNTIAKIEAGKVSLLQNGANDDQILLESTPRMKPLTYLPGADVKEGLEAFKAILLDNLSCSESNRYYIAARIINTITMELSSARGITKLSGNQGTAKSFAARMLSYLIMGSDCVSQGSVASYRSEATKSPVIIPDNLEKADRTKDVLNFLLLGATGAINQKRDTNTNSGNVYEENKAQIITTSIEPFTETELISRTIDIHFDKEFRSKHFPGETLIQTRIERNRDLIMSSFFKLIAHDVLPTFEKDMAGIIELLNTEKAGHSKDRLNELFACLYLICKQVIKYIPHSEYSGEGAALVILDDWLTEQDELSSENQFDTDPILYRLDILFDECCRLKEGFVNAYEIKGVKLTKGIDDKVTEVQLLATAQELCTAFSIISKDKNIPNPYHTPGVLGARLSNSKATIEGAGWKVRIRHKVTKGTYKHLLSKKVGE